MCQMEHMFKNYPVKSCSETSTLKSCKTKTDNSEAGLSQRATFNAVWDSVNYPVVISSNSCNKLHFQPVTSARAVTTQPRTPE